MKELTEKEKAQKYNEALERAKGVIEQNPLMEYLKKGIEYIFPELKESEDERIRKSLIDMLKNDEKCYLKEIAWLEKQGEHARFIEAIQVGDKVTRNEDGVLVNLSQLNRIAKKGKNQGEQKSSMIQWKGDNLKEVVDFTGVYKEGFEKWFHNSWEECEKYIHEHGDIFKIFNEDGSHMEVPVGAWIIKAPDGYITASRFGVSPILTELSIESNFKFKKAIEAIENYVNSFPHSQRPEIWQHINFLKSFKDRVQPQPKREWSEDDEDNLTDIFVAIDNFHTTNHKKELITFLKSLRDRCTWKPSKEQMKALNTCIMQGEISYVGQGPELQSLYNDLKKLTE